MSIPRWNPRLELTKREELIAGQLERVRKLLPFLRRHRHELFDDVFQAELASMYRDTGAGVTPIPPALMAMAALVQGYLGASDATVVKLTVLDLSVQMVLDCLGTEAPAFSQGAFADFRARFIRHDMDRRLLEKTVEIAKRTKEFDWKKLPKDLRVGIDSKPLEGAGKVEDTFNLLGHAARKVAGCAADLLGWKFDRLCREAGIPILLASSIKAGLDIDWNDAVEKDEAINTLTAQLDSLQRFLEHRLADELRSPPLQERVETLGRIRAQDLEPDPDGGGVRVREGVAEDRRVSVQDGQMRHGRKSKSKRFDGYKQHLAADLDRGLILAATVTPANRPEGEAAPALQRDVERQGLHIGELYIDRAYVNSSLVDDVLARKGEVVCKPWKTKNRGLYSKSAFKLNLRSHTISCPDGQSMPYEHGSIVEFDPYWCDICPLRSKCTTAEMGHGRTVAIAENEWLQEHLRRQMATRSGRAKLRVRSHIEHRLAHLARRQGQRARYLGTRKNTFDLRRAAVLQNLEALQRRMAA